MVFFILENIADIQITLPLEETIGTLSLTTSLVASALGAWILFGPASAATWGGIGSVIGYSLGTAFPMIALIYLGKKIRKDFPTGITFTQFIFHKIGKNLFKFIILLSHFLYVYFFMRRDNCSRNVSKLYFRYSVMG